MCGARGRTTPHDGVIFGHQRQRDIWVSCRETVKRDVGALLLFFDGGCINAYPQFALIRLHGHVDDEVIAFAAVPADIAAVRPRPI